jgi:hypothetical protein
VNKRALKRHFLKPTTVTPVQSLVLLSSPSLHFYSPLHSPLRYLIFSCSFSPTGILVVFNLLLLKLICLPINIPIHDDLLLYCHFSPLLSSFIDHLPNSLFLMTLFHHSQILLPSIPFKSSHHPLHLLIPLITLVFYSPSSSPNFHTTSSFSSHSSNPHPLSTLTVL